MTPIQKTYNLLHYSDMRDLFEKHLPGFDYQLCFVDGQGFYVIDITNEIMEPEEWRKDLMDFDSYNHFATSESLADYLSLLCCDGHIPAGEYLISGHW